MKIAIAQIWQETNTFSRIPTGLREFEQGGLFFGEEILEKMQGLGEIGDLSRRSRNSGADPARLGNERRQGDSRSAGELQRSPGYRNSRRVCPWTACCSQCTALQPARGSMTRRATCWQRCEGWWVGTHRLLLRWITTPTSPGRLWNPLTGCWVTRPCRMIHSRQACAGAQLLRSIIQGQVKPQIAWRKIPMLAPADRGKTDEYPMQEWFGLARQMEQRPGVLSVSNFPVQPWLDVPELGWSAMVVTDGDERLAEALAAELAQKAWEMRHEFWQVRRLAPQEAIRRAVQAPSGPVIICDASDSVLSGVPGDSTCLLEEMLRQQVPCLALLPLVDAQVVAQAIDAGAGAEIEVSIGGKLDQVYGKTIRVSGRVGGIAEEGMVFTLGGWALRIWGAAPCWSWGTCGSSSARSRHWGYAPRYLPPLWHRSSAGKDDRSEDVLQLPYVCPALQRCHLGRLPGALRLGFTSIQVGESAATALPAGRHRRVAVVRSVDD